MKLKIIVPVAILLLAGAPFIYWLGYQHGSRSTTRTSHVTMAAEQESIPEQINGKSEGNLPINGLSRKAILETLPDKTWYWCWETKDRKNPMQFGVNDDGQITVRQAPSNWKLELRWVMKDAGHLFVPMDDHTFRGFFIATGRPVTLFSDMVTNNLPRISSPEPGSQP